MKVRVYNISVPATSTTGVGYGTNEEGKRVKFAGEHRAMRDVGRAIRGAMTIDDLPVVDVEDHQVLQVI